MSKTPEVTPGLTHTALRTALKRADATYANEALSPHPISVAIRNARIREVFHFGVQLCDAHICSAEAIKELVHNRLGEIDEETTPFLPNMLEGDEEVKGIEVGLEIPIEEGETESTKELREGLSSTLEYGERSGERNQDEEGGIANPFAPTSPDRPHHLSPTSMTPETTTQQPASISTSPDLEPPNKSKTLQKKPKPSPAPNPEMPLPFHRGYIIDFVSPRRPIIIYQDASATPFQPSQSSHSPSQPAPTTSRTVPYPATSSAPTPDQATGTHANILSPLNSPLIPKDMTFPQVANEFARTLHGYDEAYGTTLTSIEEYENRQVLEEEIRQAQSPDMGVTPEMLWNEVERCILISARRERERRDGIKDEGGVGGEDAIGGEEEEAVE